MLRCVLPFKLEITKDKITPHAGLSLFGEFIHALNIPAELNSNLPKPGSARGYKPARFIEPLLLMLHGGGRTLEDLRKIRNDEGLCELLKLKNVPSSDATGNWLRRMGAGLGLVGLQNVNNLILRRSLNLEERKEYTLDIDATQIVAYKYDAHYTYKGERGYMPIVGHLGENGLIVGDEFREGNTAPASRNLEFIKYCCAQMPRSKKIQYLRADSATYQADIFNWCESNEISFAIGGHVDSATKTSIAQIEDHEWQDYGENQIAETVHSMNNTDQAFRLIVLKRPVPQPLFDEVKSSSTEPQALYRYTVVATNRVDSVESIMKWYNKRGETSENRIKDLKIGFGMERMPCGTFAANAIFFRLGVMAYNLFIFFKQATLPCTMQKMQIQTIRWQLYQTAGKIVKHAGSMFLKIPKSMYHLMNEIRTRNSEVLRM